jgi:DNA-binding MarR family transcriptional regulator
MTQKVRVSNDRQDLLEGVVAAVRANQLAQDLFDDAVAELAGLNRTDYRCLDVLDQRGRLTAGQIAEALSMSPGAITAVVDRLERRGLVRRIRDDHDRRRVMVEMTDRPA